MGCDEAVYLTAFLILIESIVRFHWATFFLEDSSELSPQLWRMKGPIFIIFYLFSLVATTCHVYGFFFKFITDNARLRNLLPYLYVTDSFGALVLGYGLYCNNIWWFLGGLLVLVNFFLIHIMHSIFSVEKPSNLAEELVATTKSYIHHLSSFFFVDSKEVILITTLWRSISMSGHAAQGLQRKHHISAEQLYEFNWVLSHVRNVIIVYIVWRCYNDASVRMGFARSAVGHVGYMLVRAGPVFRLGSVYVGDKTVWKKYSDIERIQIMMSGRYPFITIEVGSLFALSLTFLYWRYTM